MSGSSAGIGFHAVPGEMGKFLEWCRKNSSTWWIGHNPYGSQSEIVFEDSQKNLICEVAVAGEKHDTDLNFTVAHQGELPVWYGRCDQNVPILLDQKGQLSQQECHLMKNEWFSSEEPLQAGLRLPGGNRGGLLVYHFESHKGNLGGKLEKHRAEEAHKEQQAQAAARAKKEEEMRRQHQQEIAARQKAQKDLQEQHNKQQEEAQKRADEQADEFRQQVDSVEAKSKASRQQLKQKLEQERAQEVQRLKKEQEQMIQKRNAQIAELRLQQIRTGVSLQKEFLKVASVPPPVLSHEDALLHFVEIESLRVLFQAVVNVPADLRDLSDRLRAFEFQVLKAEILHMEDAFHAAAPVGADGVDAALIAIDDHKKRLKKCRPSTMLSLLPLAVFLHYTKTCRLGSINFNSRHSRKRSRH